MRLIKQVKVKLKDLGQSDLYKKIGDGKPYQEKITKLEGNIRTQGFKYQNGGIRVDADLRYYTGRHGILAAINVLSGDHQILADVYDATPGEWLEVFINDNAISEGLSWADKVDSVMLAREWLKKHPDSCKCGLLSQDESATSASPKGGRTSEAQHTPGSERCIAKYLGEDKWSQSAVHRLLDSEGIADEVKKAVVSQLEPGVGHGPKPGTISPGAAPAISKLSSPAQKEIVRTVKEVKVALPATLIKQAAVMAKEAAADETKSRVFDQLRKKEEPTKVATEIAAVVSSDSTKNAQEKVTAILQKSGEEEQKAKAKAKTIVEAAQEVREEQETKAANAAIRAAAEQHRQDEALRKSKEINDVVRRMIVDITDFEMPFDEDDMAQVTQLREHVAPQVMRALLSALARASAKFASIAEALAKPIPKKLKG